MMHSRFEYAQQMRASEDIQLFECLMRPERFSAYFAANITTSVP